MQCPFRENHKDGSGDMSMFLTPEINAFHCFSCGEKGRLSKLLIDKFDVGYFEAMEFVTNFKPAEGWTPTKTFEIEKYWDIVPCEMFTERGFTAETQKHFKIGMTHDGWAAIPLMEDREIKGVQYRRGKGSKRELMNTAGFIKKTFIYNYNADAEEATIVEGYSDVFRLFQFGIHAEALLGASLSDEQAEMLSAHRRLYVAMDNDEAGRRCIEWLNFKMSPYSTEILIVPFLEKDPGECMSARKWRSYIRDSTPYYEYSTTMTLLDENYLPFKEKVLRNAKI